MGEPPPDAVVTLDFGHKLAMRINKEGVHVRDVLDGDAEKFDRGEYSWGGEGGVSGVLQIYREDNLNTWEAAELRKMGFTVSSGNFIRVGEGDDKDWGEEITLEWTKEELEKLYTEDEETCKLLEKGGEENMKTEETGEKKQLRMNDVTGRNEWFWSVPAGWAARPYILGADNAFGQGEE